MSDSRGHVFAKNGITREMINWWISTKGTSNDTRVEEFQKQYPKSVVYIPDKKPWMHDCDVA